MKNYIIGFSVFLVVIFIIAIAMGQANESGDADNTGDSFYSAEPSETEPVHVEEQQNTEVPDDIHDEVTDSVSEVEVIYNSFDTTAIEIPMIPSNIPQQILKRVSYTTSYNNRTKCPNWVAWHLTAEHTDGPFPRSGEPYFENGEACGIGKVDKDIWKGDYFVDMEAKLPRQEHTDWSEMPNSMSHGHICPAGDNKWSKIAMNQSFLLTNMCPQDASLNGGGWKKLEEKCRDWAKKYEDIYIVSGPIFYEGVKKSFGKNKIGIPDAFFKVVLCVNGTPKAIGFIYSNDGTSQSMTKNVCSVNEIEEVTGMDFFHNLPDSVEDVVESMTNLSIW